MRSGVFIRCGMILVTRGGCYLCVSNPDETLKRQFNDTNYEVQVDISNGLKLVNDGYIAVICNSSTRSVSFNVPFAKFAKNRQWGGTLTANIVHEGASVTILSESSMVSGNAMSFV